MADDKQISEDLDAIVQAIGMGIANDFRTLTGTMAEMAKDGAENNEILQSVADNLNDTDKQLTRLEADFGRKKQSDAFKAAEKGYERQAALNQARQDAMMRRIENTLKDIRGIISNPNFGAGGGGGTGGPGTGLLGAAGSAALAVANRVALPLIGGVATHMADLDSDAAGGSSVGSFINENIPGAAAIDNKVFEATGGWAGTSKNDPRYSWNKGKVGMDAVTNATSIDPAMAAVTAITGDAKSKAVSKVLPKVASWFSKNSNAIVNIIGNANISKFGALCDGYFRFNKYLSDDSWTNLGAMHVAGQEIPAPDNKDPNAYYLAQVVQRLAIQAYIIAREIYTVQNSKDIRNGIVPNFDDLESYERSQVVKNVGASVESFVNGLISNGIADTQKKVEESAQKDAGSDTTEKPQELDQSGSNQGAGSNAAGLQPASFDPGGSGSSDASTSAPGGSFGGGGMSVNTGGNTGNQQTSAMEYPGGGNPSDTGEGTDNVSPGNNVAGFRTSSNQAADIGESPGFDAQASVYMGRLQQDYDLTPDQAAGILGNLGHESAGLQAGIQEKNPRGGGRGGLGWAQWTGPRRKQFEAYLRSTGQQANNPEANYGFLRHELDGAYRSSINAVKKTDNYRDATIAFENSYERAGVKAYGSRLGYAKRALAVAGASGQEQQDGETQQGDESSADTQVAQLAEGGIITPLPSDSVNSNVSAGLAPIMSPSNSIGGDDEESMTSSITPIDKRPAPATSPHPADEAKNKLSFYSGIMQHHFGYMTNELNTHMRGEVTADDQFKRAMDPLS